MSIEVYRTITDKVNFVVKSQSGGVLLKSVDFKNQKKMEEIIKHLTSLTKLTIKVERKTNLDGKFLFSFKKTMMSLVIVDFFLPKPAWRTASII